MKEDELKRYPRMFRIPFLIRLVRVDSWTNTGSKSYGSSWNDRNAGGKFTNWSRSDTYYEKYRTTTTWINGAYETKDTF